jgi:hypothetical protein
MLRQVRIAMALATALAIAVVSGAAVSAQTPTATATATPKATATATPAGQSLDAALRSTVQAAVDAWNRRDVDGFLNFFTDRGLTSVFGFSSREEAREFLPEFIGQDQITLRSLSEAQLSGARATALVELALGRVLERGRWEFALDTGTPKIDGETILPATIPSGTTAVDLRLLEYAFLYDRNALAGGNVAFRVSNTGAEPHEVILVKINRPEALADIIRTSPPGGPPSGIESIGQAFFEPGDQGNMVFTQALSAGRYGLLCFVPAPDDVPHAIKGMMSEFTVGAATPGGSVPAPPKTGNAGLQTDDPAPVMVLVALLAGAGLVFGSRLRVRIRSPR